MARLNFAWFAQCVAGSVGLFATLFLSVVEWTHIVAPCSSGLSCAKTIGSSFSRFAGVAVPYVGLAAYAVFLVLLVREVQAPDAARLVLAKRTLLLGMSLCAIGFTYISVFILKSFCVWCTATHLATFAATFAAIGDSPKSRAAWGPLAAASFGVVAALVAVQITRSGAEKPTADPVKVASLRARDLLPSDAIRWDFGDRMDVVFVGDMQCPGCHQAFPLVKAKCAQEGARLTFRHYCPGFHKLSIPLAIAVERQPRDRRAESVEGIMSVEADEHALESRLTALRATAGGNEDAAHDLVRRDREFCSRIGLASTPTIIVADHGSTGLYSTAKFLQTFR